MESGKKEHNWKYISLDDYEGIFSDFDESPFQYRSLSDDFVKELRKRQGDEKRKYDIKFSLPRSLRNAKKEGIIKKRLKTYFNSKREEMEGKNYSRLKISIVGLIVGAILLSSEFLLDLNSIESTIMKVLLVLAIPAGWYALYTGFDSIVKYKNTIKKIRLYKKLGETNFHFIDKEEMAKSMAPYEGYKNITTGSAITGSPHIKIIHK